MNLTGQRFGRWTVTGIIRVGLWECICDCGRVSQVYQGNLRSGKSRQCRSCYDARPIEDRLWSNIVIDENGCWLWIGGISEQGYGKITFQGERYAHRIIWLLYRGTIPDELCVCHHCDNPPCCNPLHLFIGTDADNLKDMREKGRWNLPVGEDAFPAKLKESEARAIIQGRADGIPVNALATRFQVCPSTISKIALSRRWKHLQPAGS